MCVCPSFSVTWVRKDCLLVFREMCMFIPVLGLWDSLTCLGLCIPVSTTGETTILCQECVIKKRCSQLSVLADCVLAWH